MMVDHVKSSWQAALTFWGLSTQLQPPIDSAKHPMAGSPAIACIGIKDRQIIFNSAWIIKNQASDCLPGIFAHEIGHHLRFPHSLRIAAELHLLAEMLIPGLPFVFQNLFWDLLVNQAVGRDLEFRRQLIRVYKIAIQEQQNVSPMFAQYLFVYEVLWGIEGEFGLSIDSGWKAHLRSFTQDFYQMEDFHDQFLFFLARFIRFLDKPSDSDFKGDPFLGDFPGLPAEEYPEGGEATPAMKKALERARDLLPIPEAGSTKNAAYRTLQRALKGGSGSDSGGLKIAADRYYRKLIDRHIEALPRSEGEERPEAFIPSVLEHWNSGDELNQIDWLESVSRLGKAAPIQLLRRDLLPDESQWTAGTERPYFEIYLDTSGSMPNPLHDTNMMTLAALILSIHCIRQGGQVRGVIYSSGPFLSSQWMQAENRAREFFLQYVGGGTDFPFQQLKEWASDRKKIYRIIISDSDFLGNAKDTVALQTLQSTLESSKMVIALLAGVRGEDLAKVLGERIVKSPRFCFVPVENMQDFAGVASTLAQALLGEKA